MESNILDTLLSYNVLTPYYWFAIRKLPDELLKELLDRETRPEHKKWVEREMERRERRNAP